MGAVSTIALVASPIPVISVLAFVWMSLIDGFVPTVRFSVKRLTTLAVFAHISWFLLPTLPFLFGLVVTVRVYRLVSVVVSFLPSVVVRFVESILFAEIWNSFRDDAFHVYQQTQKLLDLLRHLL